MPFVFVLVLLPASHHHTRLRSSPISCPPRIPEEGAAAAINSTADGVELWLPSYGGHYGPTPSICKVPVGRLGTEQAPVVNPWYLRPWLTKPGPPQLLAVPRARYYALT